MNRHRPRDTKQHSTQPPQNSNTHCYTVLKPTNSCETISESSRTQKTNVLLAIKPPTDYGPYVQRLDNGSRPRILIIIPCTRESLSTFVTLRSFTTKTKGTFLNNSRVESSLICSDNSLHRLVADKRKDFFPYAKVRVLDTRKIQPNSDLKQPH